MNRRDRRILRRAENTIREEEERQRQEQLRQNEEQQQRRRQEQQHNLVPLYVFLLLSSALHSHCHRQSRVLWTTSDNNNNNNDTMTAPLEYPKTSPIAVATSVTPAWPTCEICNQGIFYLSGDDGVGVCLTAATTTANSGSSYTATMCRASMLPRRVRGSSSLRKTR